MTDYDATGVRCMMMRGGTSRGLYLLADDLPAGPAARDDLLLRLMGTPDPRQIDGLGGATSLTSTVAVVSRTAEAALCRLVHRLACARSRASAKITSPGSGCSVSPPKVR